jgi:CRP-like cAMP-binding protein
MSEMPAAAQLLELARDLPTISVEAGDVLVRQGRPAPAIFVLVDGRLVLERDDLAFAEAAYPGAVIGEMSTVMQRPATASIRALDASVLHIAEDAESFLQRPGVALAILRLTASRLDGMTRYLADVRHQYSGMDNHLGMVNGVLETLLHHQAPPARPGSARDPLS